MEKTTTISELCAQVGMTFEDVWPILAGQQCRVAAVAEKLGEALGVKPASLMFGNSRARMRTGVLTMLANEVKTDRCHLCEIINGGRSMPSPELAERLETATGVPVRAWLDPTTYYNHVLACVRRAKQVSGKARRSKKPERRLRMIKNI